MLTSHQNNPQIRVKSLPVTISLLLSVAVVSANRIGSNGQREIVSTRSGHAGTSKSSGSSRIINPETMMATPFMRRPDSWVDRGTSASLSSITGVAGRRRRRRAMATHARDPSIPDVIVEAERKSNQQRPLRFAGYGLFGLYGAAVVLSNAGMLPEDLTLPLTFFDSEAVSLGIGGVAAVLSAYFINTEIEQREQNINRIWEEVQRRKETGTFGVKDSVTSQQKTGAGKKKKKQKRAKAKKGFGGETQRSVDMQKSVDVPIQKPEREKFVGEVKVIDGDADSAFSNNQRKIFQLYSCFTFVRKK